MALFENQANKTPLGGELVRRGLVKSADINEAVKYKNEHPGMKIGEAFHQLKLCPDKELLDVIAEQSGVKPALIDPMTMTFKFTDYLSMDIVKRNKVMPFEFENNKLKIAFADPTDKNTKNMIRLILLSKGITMEEYVTFESTIDEIVANIERSVDTPEAYDSFGKDNTQLVDNIIRSAMVKRASDIHFEPMEDRLRVRFRIDGDLIEVTSIDKAKQNQIIGRLKAISNMHQEKQTSQDGRIIAYSDYNIRVSSQRNIYGEKMVLRLMKKDANVQGLTELGYPSDDEIMAKCFNKRNCITLITAPTGEGKTTTLYSVLKSLNDEDVNITTIEDPIEIKLEGINQSQINAKAGITFASCMRAILRQDPDIILVGEIRDYETLEIAISAALTGHLVLSTVHTNSAAATVTRLIEMGAKDYLVSSTLSGVIAQRLVRRLCDDCKEEYYPTYEEASQILANEEDIQKLMKTPIYRAKGCNKCEFTGYKGRLGVYEIM